MTRDALLNATAVPEVSHVVLVGDASLGEPLREALRGLNVPVTTAPEELDVEKAAQAIVEATPGLSTSRRRRRGIALVAGSVRGRIERRLYELRIRMRRGV
jgi:hypothetical protein